MLHLYRSAGSDVPAVRIKEAFYVADRTLEREAAEARYRLEPLLARHVEIQAEILGPSTGRIAPRLVDGFCAMTREGWDRARQLLTRLRKDGSPLGVVSNFYGNLHVLLEEADLARWLDVVVDSAVVGFEKPDPRIYELALEGMNLAPADVTMVGDNFERDVRPAKALGMRTVWLRPRGRTLPERGLADLVIDRLRDL